MGSLEGKVLGNCRIIRHIGGGGMGDVYLAEQLSLGREVVVKVVRGSQGAQNANPDALHQFAQEARAIAALDHPHILPLHDYGEQEGLDYLIMPYMPDGSLGDAIAPGALHHFTLPLAPALVASIIGQTAEALQYAHDSGVVHRDVKPGNILIRVLTDSRATLAAPTNTVAERIHVLLADFGLARFLRDMAHGTGTTGTPLYGAPEQYQGRPEPATDQYSLACVAYFLLTGQLVFDGTIHELHHLHLTAQPLPPTRVNPALPPAVDTVLLRALAKEPAQRYPQVIDFARAISAAVMPGQAYSRPLWAQAPQAGQTTLAPTPTPNPYAQPQPQPASYQQPYQPVQSVPPLPASPPAMPPTPNPSQQPAPPSYYQPPYLTPAPNAPSYPA
ncbi:MAG: protein kinase, partial [Ktedonobacterales bacterium]